MHPINLDLEPIARAFYEHAHATREGTRQNFALAGIEGIQKMRDRAIPQTAAYQECGHKSLLGGILLLSIARAGCGVFAKGTVTRCQEIFPNVEVWQATIGASRPSNPKDQSARIYFDTFANLPETDWSKWIVIIGEYGLATASTAKAVFPYIREKLLGVVDANIIFFAVCACLTQTRRVLDQISKDAMIAYGSSWWYNPQTFYLDMMKLSHGEVFRTKPQDWGKCCFGDDTEGFITYLEQTLPSSQLTDKERQAIRCHFANKSEH